MIKMVLGILMMSFVVIIPLIILPAMLFKLADFANKQIKKEKKSDI